MISEDSISLLHSAIFILGFELPLDFYFTLEKVITHLCSLHSCVTVYLFDNIDTPAFQGKQDKIIPTNVKWLNVWEIIKLQNRVYTSVYIPQVVAKILKKK